MNDKRSNFDTIFTVIFYWTCALPFVFGAFNLPMSVSIFVSLLIGGVMAKLEFITDDNERAIKKLNERLDDIEKKLDENQKPLLGKHKHKE